MFVRVRVALPYLGLREKLRHVNDLLGSREGKCAPAIRLENNRLDAEESSGAGGGHAIN